MQNRIAAILRITADKKEIKDFPKLPLANSLIREILAEFLVMRIRRLIRIA
ncbi:TPA: hypothetical protein GXX44_02250 [bacterium]|jgi:hypothetical protein|nr:hypothetical protein [bacterium]